MKTASPDGPYINRLRSWASSKVHGGDRSSTRRPGRNHDPDSSLLPITNNRTNSTVHSVSTNSATLAPAASNTTTITTTNNNNGTGDISPRSHDVLDGISPDKREGNSSALRTFPGSLDGSGGVMQPKASAQAPRKGSQLGLDGPSEINEKTTTDNQTTQDKDEDRPSVVKRFFLTSKTILFHSWINILLIFVPAGIAVNFIPNMSPGVIFALNAIAIIPLAGLLSHATETVAHRMGDAIGALMNITFGNAVELIILYVQAQNLHGRNPPGAGRTCL